LAIKLKDSIRKRLLIKLIGASLLKVALLSLFWLGLGVLVYNTELKVSLRALFYAIFPTGYRTAARLLQDAFFPVYFIVVVLLIYEPVVKSVGYLQKILDSVDTLMSKDDAFIQLPGDLRPVADQLNALKLEAMKNARAAAQAEQRKNELVIYLAHDIRTPLTSVIGYLNLLDEARDMPPEQRANYIGITLDKAYRLEDLINEFFDITRFNLQSMILKKEKINLSYMLRQMADEFYPMLAPQGKRSVVQAPDGLFVLADADKLSRVFNNILKNAAAYSRENSAIVIAASLQEDGVVITFTNLGETIPEEMLGMIFEKFFRLDASRSSRSGSAGLGLAIAKEIVTAHGGDITAKSDDGTTVFTVILPGATIESTLLESAVNSATSDVNLDEKQDGV
jgi:two-component system, OmpR family, sensor histidine kinase VanS